MSNNKKSSNPVLAESLNEQHVCLTQETEALKRLRECEEMQWLIDGMLLIDFLSLGAILFVPFSQKQ